MGRVGFLAGGSEPAKGPDPVGPNPPRTRPNPTRPSENYIYSKYRALIELYIKLYSRYYNRHIVDVIVDIIVDVIVELYGASVELYKASVGLYAESWQSSLQSFEGASGRASCKTSGRAFGRASNSVLARAVFI